MSDESETVSFSCKIEKAPQYRDCCITLLTEDHAKDCEMIIKYNASLIKDKERWIEGYVDQNTESVRRRALAAKNGHDYIEIPRPKFSDT